MGCIGKSTSRELRACGSCGSPVNEKGVQASGIGGQGLKPLPSQSYHQIAVGAYVGLSSSLPLSQPLYSPILLSFSLGSFVFMI